VAYAQIVAALSFPIDKAFGDNTTNLALSIGCHQRNGKPRREAGFIASRDSVEDSLSPTPWPRQEAPRTGWDVPRTRWLEVSASR